MVRRTRRTVVIGAVAMAVATLGLGVGVAMADGGGRSTCSATSRPGWNGNGPKPPACPETPVSHRPATGGDEDVVGSASDGDTTPLPADQYGSVPSMPEGGNGTAERR